jgi:hypothetical protein
MFGFEHNVRVRLNHEHEPHFMFVFDGLAEPNLEHCVRFMFEHCLKCSEPDPGQSSEGGKRSTGVDVYKISDGGGTFCMVRIWCLRRLAN